MGAQPASPPTPRPHRLTCNNLPGLADGCRACGGVRAAIAAPWPAAAAQPTGRAWPAAGAQLTWGVGWPLAGLGGRGCLQTQNSLLLRASPGGRVPLLLRL